MSLIAGKLVDLCVSITRYHVMRSKQDQRLILPFRSMFLITQLVGMPPLEVINGVISLSIKTIRYMLVLHYAEVFRIICEPYFDLNRHKRTLKH